MRYAIEYRRKFAHAKKTISTTFIHKSLDIETVKTRFERMHNNQLTVETIVAKPSSQRRQDADDRQAIADRQKRKPNFQLIISVDGNTETHTFDTLSDAADQVKFYADNCTISPDSICISKNK